MSKDNVVVKFIQSWRGYSKDESAGFTAEQAKALIDGKVAVAGKGGAPKAAAAAPAGKRSAAKAAVTSPATGGAPDDSAGGEGGDSGGGEGGEGAGDDNEGKP